MLGKKNKSKLPIDREKIKAENPEKYYKFAEDEIGRGKFSVVKRVVHRETGKQYAAKIIKYDADTLKFAIREYDLMEGGAMCIEQVALMHEAYLVRKYLIIIMTLCDGKTLLEFFSKKHSITEEDVAVVIRELCKILQFLHCKNIVHLDIRPTNIRMTSLTDIKLLDYNSARHLANKKAGEVVDVIGDTEFCAPEMLSFDRVQPGSDMWSVAVIMFILLFGFSPYFYEDEEQVSIHVESCSYPNMDKIEGCENVTAEAKDFLKKIFKRGPEMRIDACKALSHKWLSEDYKGMRARSTIVHQDKIGETDERLYSEEEEEYIEASCIFKTFEEDEHVSTEDESDDEEC